MKNMTVNIYFFRNTQKGRIEFEELVKYFMDTPNFEIFYNDTELNMVYNDTEFGFKYMYKKTKVSQVEESQQNIVNTIRRLEEAGEISLSRGSEDEFVL